MARVYEIVAAKYRLDHRLPVELSSPWLDYRHQLLISLPSGDRGRFPFRHVFNLAIHVVRAPDRSLGRLTNAFRIRYHLEKKTHKFLNNFKWKEKEREREKKEDQSSSSLYKRGDIIHFSRHSLHFLKRQFFLPSSSLNGKAYLAITSFQEVKLC